MLNSIQSYSHSYLKQPLPRGGHICQIYTNEQERFGALLNLVRGGLQQGEPTMCFTGKPIEALLDEFLADYGLSLVKARDTGRFSLGNNEAFYLDHGVFNYLEILEKWESFIAESESGGATGVWAVGEVLPDLSRIDDGLPLLAYETKLNEVLHDHPATLICQYDAGAFNGPMIMGVLKAHPLVLAEGRVAANPFYTLPDLMTSH